MPFQFKSRILQYPRKTALFLTKYQILPVCFCFQQNSSFSQLRLYFLSETLPIPRQKQTSKYFFYKTAPSGCFCLLTTLNPVLVIDVKTLLFAVYQIPKRQGHAHIWSFTNWNFRSVCRKSSKLTIKLSQGNQIKLFWCLFCQL